MLKTNRLLKQLPNFSAHLFTVVPKPKATMLNSPNQSKSKQYATALMLTIGLLTNTQTIAGFTTPQQTLTNDKQETIIFHQQGQPNDQVPIFLLGGGPGFSSWNLEPIQTLFQQLGHATYLKDMRGIGENAALTTYTEDKTITELWVEDLEALRQTVGKQPQQKVILAGHSWGALMAMLYTREFPQYVQQIILLNPVDPEKMAMRDLTENIHQKNQVLQNTAWDDESAWSNEIVELDSDEQARKITEMQITQVLPTYFYDYQQGQKYAKMFSFEDFNIDLNVNAWKAYDANPVSYSEIKNWQLPIDFLDCRQDSLMPENLHALENNQVLRKVMVLDKCSHFPWIEQPKAFKQSIQMILEH